MTHRDVVAPLTPSNLMYVDPYGSQADKVTRSCMVEMRTAQDATYGALHSASLSKSSLTLTFDKGMKTLPAFDVSTDHTDNLDDYIIEEASCGALNQTAPRLSCPEEFYPQLMVMMPDLDANGLVERVRAFLSLHDMPHIHESYCSETWEIMFACDESSFFRVVFYSCPDIHGSCVELHRDSGCPMLVVTVCCALRGWLNGDVTDLPVHKEQYFLEDCTDNGGSDWDWLDDPDREPLDMPLVSELALLQNSAALATLREKLRPKIQDIIDKTAPVDVCHLSDLLSTLLQDDTDYLKIPDIISLSHLAARTISEPDLQQLSTVFKLITTPIPVEVTVRLQACRVK